MTVLSGFAEVESGKAKPEDQVDEAAQKKAAENPIDLKEAARLDQILTGVFRRVISCTNGFSSVRITRIGCQLLWFHFLFSTPFHLLAKAHPV